MGPWPPGAQPAEARPAARSRRRSRSAPRTGPRSVPARTRSRRGTPTPRPPPRIGARSRPLRDLDVAHPEIVERRVEQPLFLPGQVALGLLLEQPQKIDVLARQRQVPLRVPLGIRSV